MESGTRRGACPQLERVSQRRSFCRRNRTHVAIHHASGEARRIGATPRSGSRVGWHRVGRRSTPRGRVSLAAKRAHDDAERGNGRRRREPAPDLVGELLGFAAVRAGDEPPVALGLERSAAPGALDDEDIRACRGAGRPCCALAEDGQQLGVNLRQQWIARRAADRAAACRAPRAVLGESRRSKRPAASRALRRNAHPA